MLSPRPSSPDTRLAAAEAVAAAAERHLDHVYRYALYLTGDRTTADDVAAATFERALRVWHRFDPRRGGERTFLCQIARSLGIDHLRSDERRRRREAAYAAASSDADEPVYGEGFSPELEDGLRRLSAGEREVIALRLLLDLDARATARVLGISETACSTRLSRALRRLEEGMTSNVHA
jgi:RNA polymerase sigma-70 factor (ECF subfamily)